MARTIFRNATLFDGITDPATGSSVVVEGDRIVDVGPNDAVASAQTVAPSDRVIDVAGGTVMPGMVQAHWHGTYKDLDFEPPPVGLEKPPGYLMLLAAKQAQLALRCGFTSVVGAAVSDAIDAQLKMAIEDGVLEGPRVVPCGRWLITTGDSNDLPEFWWWDVRAPGAQRICDGADEFRKGARREILEGAEFIKLFCDSGHALLYGSDFVSMTEEELHAAVEATHHRGKKVRVHVTAKPWLLRCIQEGVEILDHADGMDEECIERMLEAGTFVCPSLYLTKAILDTITGLGEGRENEPFFIQMRRDFEHMCEILPVAAKAGVKLLVGDDWGTTMTPHGDYWKEMQLYVDEAGVPAVEVLRWATRNGAQCMGMGDELGVLAKGRLADLIVVDGDPTADIAVLGRPGSISTVMKNGVVVEGGD